MVMWDVRAVAEFDIENILTSVSAFICEDAYASEMNVKILEASWNDEVFVIFTFFSPTGCKIKSLCKP